MKKSLFFFALLFFYKFTYALSVDDVIKDIKSLPTVKITYSQPEEKNRKDNFDYEKIKAVQVFLLPSDIREVKSLFSKWQECGVNTVIIRVFHNNGDRYHMGVKTQLNEGVYFKTSAAPLIYDVLHDIIPIAKTYNLKVFAWMTTRYADYGVDNLEPVIAYSLDNKKYFATKGLNIFSLAVQRHIIKIFSDLASYPIDGILLQDDLFLRFNEGFNNSTVTLFKSETGKNAKPELFFIKLNGKITYTDAFWEWRQWKSNKIADFISTLNENIKAKNPSLKLMVNLTYEAVSNPKGALAWLAHDLSVLKDVSDYFSLMAYHRQIKNELKLDFIQTKQYLQSMINQCLLILSDAPQRFLFKVQVKDWDSNKLIEETELRSIITSATGIENLSLAVVPYPPDLPTTLLRELFFKRIVSQKKQ